MRRFAWRVPKQLDIDAMRDAARRFIGTHDFAGFTADRKKKNTVRTIASVTIDTCVQFGGPVLEIHLSGDGFLSRQVRMMVAVPVAIGSGAADLSLLQRLLVSADRTDAPAPAPPYGLTLLSVDYDEQKTRNDE